MRLVEALQVNWHLKVLSVVIAIVLWVYVLGAENPTTTRDVNCPVRASNVPSDLEVIGVAPEEVKVRVQGRERAFEHADFDRMYMAADLSGAKVPEQKVRLSPAGIPAGLRVLPGHTTSATFKLDKIIERAKPVMEEQRGQPAKGYMITSITPDPPEVTVRGAVSRLHRVARVFVVIDTSGMNSTTEVDVVPEARDNSSLPVTGLTFKPERVKVKVEVKRVNVKTLPVRPRLGDPPSGWQVSAVQVSPAVVTITGGGDALARITAIATVPIDISGLRGTKPYAIPLSVPDQVSVLDQASVQVTVTTRRFRPTPSRPETPPAEPPPEPEPPAPTEPAPAEEPAPPAVSPAEPMPEPEGTQPPPTTEETPTPPEGGGTPTEVPTEPEANGGP